MNKKNTPDLFLDSVLSIDLDALKARGIDTLLLDMDNTILPRDCQSVPPELSAWASSLIPAGFKVCLLSNNWHGRIARVADKYGFELVSKAVKPLPPAYLLALHRTKSRARNAAMIGDQFFTDILGGSLLGVYTILVEPLSEKDLKHTLMLRHLEKRVLKGRCALSGAAAAEAQRAQVEE